MSGRNSPRSKAGPNAEMDTVMAAARAEGAATERKRILDIASCDSGTTLSAAAGQAIDSGTSAAAFATAVIKTSAGDNRGEAFMMARRGLQPRVSGTSGNRGKDYVQAKQGSSSGNIHERIEGMRGSVPGLPKIP